MEEEIDAVDIAAIIEEAHDKLREQFNITRPLTYREYEMLTSKTLSLLCGIYSVSFDTELEY